MVFTKSLVGMLTCILALSAAVIAQQPQASPGEGGSIQQKRRLREGRGFGDRMRGRGRLPFLRELNLTEEQRTQHREIMQRHAASTKAQRDELAQIRQKRVSGSLTAEDEAKAQALRQELQASMQSMKAELASILTPEQRARLAELESKRRSRMDERMKRRERFRTDPQQ